MCRGRTRIIVSDYCYTIRCTAVPDYLYSAVFIAAFIGRCTDGSRSNGGQRCPGCAAWTQRRRRQPPSSARTPPPSLQSLPSSRGLKPPPCGQLQRRPAFTPRKLSISLGLPCSGIASGSRPTVTSTIGSKLGLHFGLILICWCQGRCPMRIQWLRHMRTRLTRIHLCE